MWKIRKEFSFSFGHRVHSQHLPHASHSVDTACACRHLHGHEGVVEVELSASALDHTGMVTDFKNLNWLKKMLDSVVDHKFILDCNDPAIHHLLPASFSLIPVYIAWDSSEVIYGAASEDTHHLLGHVLSLAPSLVKNKVDAEYFESFFIVDFPPTSEHLSKWLYNAVKFKMSALCNIDALTWWETAKSYSRYSE